MKLRLKTGIFVHIPILKTIVEYLMTRCLHFTDYPYWRGQVKNLMRAHHATLRLETDSIYRERLFETLSLLRPDEGFDWRLVRIGPTHDGGYWVPDRFSRDSRWITFGLGENVEFENHLLRNGCLVDAFDHSVGRKPKNLHKGVKLHKLGISDIEKKDFVNLASVIRLTQLQTSNWCLKSDIEGWEFNFLPDLLSMKKMPQVMVIEFHGLLDLDFNQNSIDCRTILKDLRTKFYLAHVNVNNFASVVSGSGFVFPDVVEAVYISRDTTPPVQIESFADFVEEIHKYRNNPLAPSFRLIFPG